MKLRTGTRVIAAILACAMAAWSAEGDIEHIKIESYDGMFVAAAIRKPAGEGPFPAILFIHGGVGANGSYAAERMLRGRLPEHFHKLGFVCLATDYRRFHFGEDEIRDVTAAYHHLERLPYVDNSRVAVIGGSHGGYLAQMLAMRVRPAATVSFAGLTDIEGMFYEVGLELRQAFSSWDEWMEELLTHRERTRKQSESGQAPVKDARRVPGGNAPLQPGSGGYEVALELGWRYPERRDVFRAISPKENVDKVHGPVLYLVGGKDRLRFAGQEWVNELVKRGIEARYSEHEGMPHGFYWGNSKQPPRQFHEALLVTTQFVEKHLGEH